MKLPLRPKRKMRDPSPGRFLRQNSARFYWLSEKLQGGKRQHGYACPNRTLAVRGEGRRVERGQRLTLFHRCLVTSRLGRPDAKQHRWRTGSPAELAEVLGDHLWLALDDVLLAQLTREHRRQPTRQRRIVIGGIGRLAEAHLRLARSHRQRGLRLGDADDTVEQLLADFGGVRAHGELQMNLIWDDVVLKATVDGADGDDPRLERILFARHEFLQR